LSDVEWSVGANPACRPAAELLTVIPDRDHLSPIERRGQEAAAAPVAADRSSPAPRLLAGAIVLLD
jgi:hypothetical protein